MSLHIKYRPQDFNEIIGNKSVVNSLDVMVNKKDPPHTYLFIGPSGCGKTTLARITAEKLGCIDSDLTELNAANFRGIETAREIIQQMRLATLSGGSKAWIIDEAHQLTKDGQAALLKALEDTPSHVYFLLATTDPQKLLPTIKNRCSSFSVQLLSEDDIFYLIQEIAIREKKKITDKVLDQIAKDCLGSPRAAIIMLDKIIDLPENKMLKAAKKAIETESNVLDLCRALINRSKWKNVANILKTLSEKEEPEIIRMAVLGYCKSVLLKEENDQAFLIMDSFKDPFYNTGFAGLVRVCYEAICK